MLEALPQILPGVDQQVAQTVVARVHQARHQGADRREGRRRSTATASSVAVRFEGKDGDGATRRSTRSS